MATLTILLLLSSPSFCEEKKADGALDRIAEDLGKAARNAEEGIKNASDKAAQVLPPVGKAISDAIEKAKGDKDDKGDDED